MSFTMNFGMSLISGGDRVTTNDAYTCATKIYLEETVADAVTDQVHLVAIDVSALKCFIMVSDQALTVETNSGTVPQETFNLTANTPVIFRTGDSAIFAGDVTALYLTNSSGAVATLTLLAGMDV